MHFYFMILLHTGNLLAQDVYTAVDRLTAGFFEAHFESEPAMSLDGGVPPWLPIHSSVLMFDQQLHCRPIFSVLPAHC